MGGVVAAKDLAKRAKEFGHSAVAVTDFGVVHSFPFAYKESDENFKIIFTEAVFWSILWTVMVSISIRIFPFTIEHDYPDDVRKAANISKPSKKL